MLFYLAMVADSRNGDVGAEWLSAGPRLPPEGSPRVRNFSGVALTLGGRGKLHRHYLREWSNL